MPEPLDLDALERFWRRVDKTDETGCWLWLGTLSGREGYGSFSVGSRKDGTRKNVNAHRWIYEQLVGPIPKGQHIDHLCQERRCVNVAHMEPVSPGENVLRGEGPTSRAYKALQAKLKETEETLRATRAERDWLLTVEAADAMLCDALTRTERAEAERDDWRGTAANALKMQGAAIARAERDAAAIGRVEAVMGANPESRSGSALASDIRAALRGDNA